MNKDSIANTVSFVAAGSAMVNIESILTILLVTSGIVLNIMRILDRKKN